MNFAGSIVDIAIGALGMWAVQTFGWPFLKTWIKNSLKNFVNTP